MLLSRSVSTGRFNTILDVFDRETYRRSIPPEWSHLPLKLRWLKPSLFFVGASVGIFATSAYLVNRETDACISGSMDSGLHTSEDNESLRVLKQTQDRKAWTAAQRDDNNAWTSAFCYPILYLRANARPETFMVAFLLPISLAWHIPRLRTSLFRHWTHSFRSRKSYTILTAMFCHQLPFQWFNLFAAWATIPIASAWFMHATDGVQHESSPWYHFAAFCVSAGMFSFLAPQWIAYLRFRTAFQQLARGVPGPYTNMKINKSLSYGLGVSGTVHACLTLSVCSHPSAPASHLVPDVSRGALWALICTVESVCMFLLLGNVGWASNMAGVAFGAAYSVFGPSFWISMRMFMHRIQFPKAWELRGEGDKHPYPGKHLDDPHPLFKRSFGGAMGWNSLD